MANSRTSKKMKIIGKQQYINMTTGEVEDFDTVNYEDRDFNFTKIWLNSILQTLGLLSNQKTKVAYHIIDNLNKENQYIGTQRQIAERCGVSLKTVSSTMKVLLDADFLRSNNSGVYCVNPDVMFKGNRNARLNVLQQYDKMKQQEISDDEKIKNLENTMLAIQREIDKLKYKQIKESKEGA